MSHFFPFFFLRPVPTAMNMFTQSPDLIGFVRALAWLLPWHPRFCREQAVTSVSGRLQK